MRGVGPLRDRLGIVRDTLATDTQGGRSATASTLATIWGAVRPLSATERLQAQAVGSHVQYEVEIQYRADVTALQRLSWTPYLGSAKTLHVSGWRLKDGLPHRLLLDCVEVV